MTGQSGQLTGKSIQFIKTMQPPDWSRCTEEELWRYVAWHLEGEGIRSVLVGGAVVAIYMAGVSPWKSVSIAVNIKIQGLTPVMC